MQIHISLEQKILLGRECGIKPRSDVITYAGVSLTMCLREVVLNYNPIHVQLGERITSSWNGKDIS